MLFSCNLCGLWIIPNTSGLCNDCYKISRLVKVSSTKVCLDILQKNIINKETYDKKHGIHLDILDKFQNTKKS